MKIFLDTASLKDIGWAAQAGLIDGVTTNPSLLAKQAGDLDPRDVLKEICSLVEGPVSAEVVAVDADGMVREGRELARIADHIVVKVPMLEAGLVAVRRLAAEGIKTNVTLCFSSPQCLLAAKAGASYVSPFIGRLDDAGQDGMEVIREARAIFDNYQIATEILAASIRHPRHVVAAAMLGADAATLPPEVLKKLLQHPLTDRGLEQFLADWRQLAARAKAPVDLPLAPVAALRLAPDAGAVGGASPRGAVAAAVARAARGAARAGARHPRPRDRRGAGASRRRRPRPRGRARAAAAARRDGPYPPSRRAGAGRAPLSPPGRDERLRDRQRRPAAH